MGRRGHVYERAGGYLFGDGNHRCFFHHSGDVGSSVQTLGGGGGQTTAASPGRGFATGKEVTVWKDGKRKGGKQGGKPQ